MTIGNALAFIKRGQIEPALRRKLNTAATSAEFFSVLSDEQLTFSVEEFDEAYRKTLVECQHEETADQLKEFKVWWDLVFGELGVLPCAGRCSGGCC